MSAPNGHDANWPPILRPADFLAAHLPPEWLIEGMVQQGRLYSCTSLTGHGKTAVWLYIGTMVQAGRRFAGLEVVQGDVLIMAGENPDDTRARMHGMKLALGLRVDDLPMVLPETFELVPEAIDRMRYAAAVRLAKRFVLVIVDTAPAFSTVREELNNTQQGDWARTLRLLTELPGHPAVVALTHPKKDAERKDLLPRGGGAFLNEVDGNLTIWSEDQGEQATLHWHGKIRGPEFNPMTFRLRTVPTGFADKKGREETTVIAEPMGDFEAANKAKQSMAEQEVVLRLLRDEPGLSQADLATRMGLINERGPMRWKAQRLIEGLYKEKLIRRVLGKHQLTQSGERFLKNKDL